MAKIRYLGFVVLLLLFVPGKVMAQVPSMGWPTVAGNLARTGWVADQASFTADPVTAGAFIQWYRPIDAYIPNYVNMIAANDLIYISTARGLYALKFDTGELIWRYDTEMPLGNSPTIASVNGVSMAFVGGYDKKLHALNALTGVQEWEFNGAQAGYQANPIVVGNLVYAGNRDGHVYALNAQTGSLSWQYPAAGVTGIGPIKQSPAYKDGVIYLVTDYQYAYALSTSGSLVWKSAKLTGNSYDTYWPVVYTDKSVTPNHDYVIFTSGMAYREDSLPGTRSINGDDSYYFYDADAGTFGQTISLNEPWAVGKTILNYQSVIGEYQQKPWRKFYTILDANNGQEFSVPFPALPIYSPGIQHPPIINPQDNLIYTDNHNNGGRTRVMGWKFGTPYFSLTGLDGADDEPLIISGGGKNLYRSLCCQREVSYVTIDNLLGVNSVWPYWDQVLRDKAPGYDKQIFYLDPWVMAQITGAFGNSNGVYGYHGDQNPFISYKNMAFIHRGNSILAFGNGPNKCPLARDAQNHCWGSVPALNVSQTESTPTTTELTSRLETQINNILTACDGQNNCGFLKPAFLDDSQFTSIYNFMQNYFESPADTLYTLSLAYPKITNSDLKSRLKTFLTTKFYPKYFHSDGAISFRIGWAEGVQRDDSTLPPEMTADFLNYGENYRNGYEGRWSWFDSNYLNLNPNSFYAMYVYAKNVATTSAEVSAVYDIAKNKLTEVDSCAWADCFQVPDRATDAYLTKTPQELNAYIAGYQGFINLLDLAGRTTADAGLRSRANTELTRLKTLRVNGFSKDSPFLNFAEGYGWTMLNISRNFLMLTPELADYLRSNRLSAVQTALGEYNRIGPYWFVPHFDASTAESGFQNLYDYPSNFQARAWILKSSRDELYKYLEVPAMERGDLFYIQNLIATIEAPSGSGTPAPKSGDANNDGRVDGVDYVIWLNHYGQNVSGVAVGDFNNNGYVDGVDYVIWLTNYGT